MSFGDYFLILAAIALAALLLVYRVTVFKFVAEVRVELEKCSWPWDPQLTGLKKYKELLESTLVVIISVVLLGGFVTTSDLILAHVVGALTGGGVVAGMK